jgi:putative methanogenesis marker protein 3
MEKGLSLGRVLQQANVHQSNGCIVAIGRSSECGSQRPTKFYISTSKGDITFNIIDRELADRMTKAVENGSLSMRSLDANSLAIGSIVCDAAKGYVTVECNEGDIILDQAGSERSNTVLRFCKKKHTASYAMVGQSTIGRVISGMQILKTLSIRDPIEFTTSAESMASECYSRVSDMNMTVAEDGLTIITKAAINLNCHVPESAEVFLHRFSEGTVEACSSTGSYLRISGPDQAVIDERNPVARKRGTVTLRNSGCGRGQIYVYRVARAPNESHTAIGEIEAGMALFDVAQPGDHIAVRVSPLPVKTIGLTQSQAAECLESRGLHHIRVGCVEDYAVVVRQEPKFTMDAIGSGSVTTTGSDPEEFVAVDLYDALAPTSAKYFRSATGLDVGPVGSLEMILPYSPITGAMLLQGDLDRTRNMVVEPENCPTKIVESGEIGITNSINSKMGMMGIRLQDSAEFGPSCEVFDSTNIIGKIDERDLEKIKRKKRGEKVYFIEGGR